MAKNDKVVKRGVYLYLDGSEIKNDIQSVEKEMRVLVSMQKKMVVGSEEYVRAGQKIRALKGIIAEHNAQLRETEQQVKKNTISFGKFVDGFNRFFGIIGAAIAALTGFTLAIRSLRDEKNKLEESQAGLQALTGLDNDSITWLTAQAKKLSTTMTKEGLRVRQSANEILDAFMLVGSAKPELLGDKEALAAVTEEAMRLQAAAKDITLNEAVDALTLSLNQYGDQTDQAARYTNVLAAGSKAGAANIASQAKAIRVAGTAAASANVPIEQTVGLIETLAYKGIKDEVAGTGLKKFFLVLQTGAKDTNPAIVGLDQALENLKNKKMDAGAIKKMFGEEGYNTASVVIRNTDMVKQFTEAVTGTNIALEQSAINSNTAAAKLAQAKNELKLAGIELADRLNPAITVSTNMVTNLVKYLPGVLDWFKKWGAEALVCAGYFLLLGTRTMLVTKAAAAYHAVISAGRTLMIAYRIAVDAVNIALVGGIRNLVALRTAMVASNATTKVLAATTAALRGVYFLLTGQITLAGKAFRALRVVMAGGWVGVALTAIAAVTLAIVTMNKKMTETERTAKAINDLNKRASDEYDREAAKIDMLVAKIHNNNLSLGERRKAIKELNEIVPGYLASIDDEGKLHEDNKKAIDDYLTSLEKEIKMKIYADELTELYRKRREQRKIVNKVQGYVASSQEAYDLTQYQDLNAHVTAGQILTKYKDKLVDVQKELADTDSLIKALNEEISKDEISSALSPDKVEPDEENTGGGGGGNEDEKKKKERIQKELLAIEEKYALEREKLQHEFLSKRNMTQEEYEQFSNDLEEQSLKEKLSILGLEEKKHMEIQNKILALRDKFQKECAIKDEKGYKEGQKSMEDGLELQLDTCKRGLQQQLYAGKIDQEEQKKSYLEYLSTLYDEIKDNPLLSDEFKNKMSIALSDKQLEEQKGSYDKAVENLNNLKNQYRDIGESFGETMADFFVSEEKSLKEFLAKILVTVLDALEKQLIAEQAAAIGLVTIKEITLKGLAGIATAAAKIALITAAFETAKGILGGFADGGYTGSGAWNEPKGIVHSNEFVSNRFAVSNPNLRPVFDLIDYAQRTGTVANLTGNDVAAVLSTGVPSDGAPPSGAPPSGQPAAHPDAAMISVLQECIKVMRAVKDRFEQPIVTETYATGKRGTIEAEKLVNKMENNVSRNYLKS